jgi:flagellar biosynthetic protein FliR
MPEWGNFLGAMTLALVRVSGMVAFAPFFSSTALPIRAKAVFVLAVAYLLAPLVAGLPNARVSLGFSALLGELAVGLVYGLTLTLLNEMLLFAGQILRACNSASRWSTCWTPLQTSRRRSWATCFS